MILSLFFPLFIIRNQTFSIFVHVPATHESARHRILRVSTLRRCRRTKILAGTRIYMAELILLQIHDIIPRPPPSFLLPVISLEVVWSLL